VLGDLGQHERLGWQDAARADSEAHSVVATAADARHRNRVAVLKKTEATAVPSVPARGRALGEKLGQPIRDRGFHAGNCLLLSLDAIYLEEFAHDSGPFVAFLKHHLKARVVVGC
jgi:hypothetical protein